MGEKRYFIVEFDDGLQVIPQNWFTNKERSQVFWPTRFKNFKAYDAAVEKMKDIDPEERTIVQVKRIFGASENFQTAKLKLKDAEKISDLNSDEESNVVQRKARKERAARAISESTDNSSDAGKSPSSLDAPGVLQYPVPPVKRSTKEPRYTAKKMESQQFSSRLPSSQTTPQRKRAHSPCNSKFKEKMSEDIADDHGYVKNKSHEECGTDIRDSATLKNKQPNCVGGHNLIRSMTGLETPPQKPDVGDSEFRTFLVKQFAILKQKLNIIICNQNELSDRWEQNNEKAQCEATVLVDENVEKVMVRLPISNNAALDEVEEAIIDAACYKKIVKELAKIGGNNLKSVALNLVKRLFTDQVAQEYSWEGKKKKKRFCDLKICHAILDATRVVHKDATDCEISQIIKDWLRHAAERAQNKKGPPAKEPTSDE